MIPNIEIKSAVPEGERNIFGYQIMSERKRQYDQQDTAKEQS